MAISLLGALQTATNKTPVPTNTATPYNANVAPAAAPVKTATQLVAPVSATSTLPKPTTQTSTPMGVNATSPYSNQSAPSTTLPKTQVATVTPTTPSAGSPGTTGSTSNPYVKNAQGTWVLASSLGGSTTPQPPPTQINASDPITSIPATSVAAVGNTNTGTVGGLAPQAAPPVGTTNVVGANGVTNSTINPPTQTGLLSQAANIASGPSADYLNQQAQANAYNQQLQQSYSNEGQAIANIDGSPRGLNFAQGAENVIRNQALLQQQGLATAYQGAAGLLGAANTQQSNEQTGLLGAANSAAPIQVSPGNYLASPLTGVASSAAAGQQQGIQSATNWAIAQQNMAQGADYQGQAQNLSTALQTMSPVGQKLTDFLTTTGQNPLTSPLLNQKISTINAQNYPQQAATLNAAVNDIRSYAIQILGSQSGANPTDVTSAVNSFDFTNFSPTDLSNFLGDLNNLGNTRLGQLQTSANSSYGANSTVGTPAEGAPATDNGSLNTGTMQPSSYGADIVKAGAGTAGSILSGLWDALAGSASNVVGSAAGTGIAAKVLGL